MKLRLHSPLYCRTFFGKTLRKAHILREYSDGIFLLCSHRKADGWEDLGLEVEEESKICKRCKEEYIDPGGGAPVSYGRSSGHCIGGYGGRITNDR